MLIIRIPRAAVPIVPNIQLQSHFPQSSCAKIFSIPSLNPMKREISMSYSAALSAEHSSTKTCFATPSRALGMTLQTCIVGSRWSLICQHCTELPPSAQFPFPQVSVLRLYPMNKCYVVMWLCLPYLSMMNACG